MAKIEVDDKFVQAVRLIVKKIEDDAEKWGGYTFDVTLQPEAWVTLLAEELGGVAKNSTRNQYDDTVKHLVKLAAVTVQALIRYEHWVGGMSKLEASGMDDDDD